MTQTMHHAPNGRRILALSLGISLACGQVGAAFPTTTRTTPIRPESSRHAKTGARSRVSARVAPSTRAATSALTFRQAAPGQTETGGAQGGGSLGWESGAGSPGSGGADDTVVNTVNGNKLTSLPLVGWVARGGLPVEFTLHHNSRGQHSGKFGPKWTCSLDLWLLVDTTTGNATVHWGDDNTQTHARNYDGTFLAPVGFHDTLVATPGAYTLTTPDQTRYRFTNPNGTGWLCTRIDEPSGNAIALAYNTQDFLLTATDPTGRVLSLSYNPAGKVAAITDPIGRRIDLSYDTAGDLIRVAATAPDNTTIAEGFAYNARHDIVAHVTPRGKTTSFSYDTTDRLLSQTDPMGVTSTLAYGNATRTVTDSRGARTVHTYDASGRLTATTDPTGATTRYAYDFDNNRTRLTDARGSDFIATFDSRGNQTSLTDPLGGATTVVYDATNHPTSITLPSGRVLTMAYDSAGRPTTIANADGRTVRSVYDTHGQLVSEIDPLGKITLVAYDAHGNPNRITDASGASQTAQYDRLGRLLSEAGPDGVATTYVHDAFGRVESVQGAGGRLARFSYDADGNVTGMTDPNGGTNQYVYDDCNRLVAHADALGRTVRLGYDSAGNQVTFTDARGAITQFSFSPRGEVTGTLFPDGVSETFSYLSTGQLLRKTDGAGVSTTQSYDALGRVTRADYSDNTSPVKFQYDAEGRLTNMSDGIGFQAYSYDASGRLLQRATPQGAVNYGWDAADRLRSLATPLATLTYAYDDAGRLTSASGPGGATQFTIDAFGRRVATLFANGASETRRFSPSTGFLDAIEHRGSNGARLHLFEYGYDAAGRIVRETRDVSATNYAYDAVGQLIAETKTGAQAGSLLYRYDASGNRIERIRDGVPETLTYDAANRLLSSPGRQFSYDAAGRVSSVASAQGVTQLEWDGSGSLIRLVSGGDTVSFLRNGFGQLVGRREGSASPLWYLRLDDASEAPTVVEAGRAYLTDERGAFAMTQSGSFSALHLDQKGSIRGISDGAGLLSGARDSDAFGGGATVSGVRTPFGFGGSWGYRTDASSGLILIGYRAYSPDAGRFLSRDPLLAGDNWYAYCGSDPVNFADPSGLVRIVASITDTRRRRGRIRVIADPGDILPGGGRARGGEILMDIPFGNMPKNPGNDPTKVGGYGPFPPGTWPIIGPVRSTPKERPSFGPGKIIIGRRGDAPQERGTWIHGGRGNHTYPTLGCIRINDDDWLELAEILRRNRGRENQLIF